MQLREIVERLKLQVLAGEKALDREVSSGYCSDLISDFIANGAPGCLWLTLQTHMNVVAVALLTGAAGVVFTGGRGIPPEVCRRAEAEGLPLLHTHYHTFEIAGRLYRLLYEK
ncbi:DRTGG domain-containing protein [Moorella sulfitireducens]|uniref:DRTGG domain-containing protein n=1 Tax=Neomoorella sulfitireducens TaxID=2972948 RepID=UPI0021ACF054|nr:DRTGG domain-containing protein [Moorella sulfitireducens]